MILLGLTGLLLVDNIALEHYSDSMPWNIEFHAEFDKWFRELAEDEQDAVLADVLVLAKFGPTLGRPRVDTLKGTKIRNLKELRVRHTGEPIRVLFAFDPWQRGILLVGGNKAGDRSWYKKHIPIAEERFRQHLEDSENEQ